MRDLVASLTRFLGALGLRLNGANGSHPGLPGDAPVEAEAELRRAYHFVRPAADGFSTVKVTRSEDGAVIQRYRPRARWPLDTDEWRDALRTLREVGYVELTEAIRTGLITKDQADELVTNEVTRRTNP